ncbi:MAG TPA: hypothetical protein VG755_26790 [Nannocystaceae bacterium]|nr:hypothetical protein [Nannocystaceae bacterium]
MLRTVWPFVLLAACGPSTPGSGQDGGGSAGDSTTSTTTTTESSTSGAATTSTTTAADTSSSTSGTTPSLCPPPEQTFDQRSEPCRGGAPLPQVDDAGPSGLAQCPDGTLHSYGVACCGADEHPPCPGAGYEGECVVDADCDADVRGECRSYQVVGNTVCSCFYDACVTDADCDAGDACLCAGQPAMTGFEVAHCVPGDCRTDADCDGFRCALSGAPCTLAYELHCHGADDECQSDADCSEGFCGFAPDTARWVCVGFGPPCD